MKTYLLSISVLLITGTTTWAAPPQPIEKLAKIEAKSTVFRVATHDRPIVLRTEKEIGRHFARADRIKVLKEVDLTKQVVLVFAWRGSGQDRLAYTLLKSNPPQIAFQFTRGRTRDLRPHVYIYAMRSDIRCPTSPTNGGPPTRPPTTPPSRPPSKPPAAGGQQFVKVDIQGLLNARVVAIGGETTGITITANGVTLELDFPTNRNLRRVAQQLHGKTVRVQGDLTIRRGVTIRRRTIVNVSALSAAGSAPAGNSYLDDRGQFRTTITLRDSQTGFAGNSGRLWTISPDGSWQHRRFVNRELRPVDQKGKLSPAQIRQVAEALAAADMLRLPQTMGRPPSVNPHRFSLRFGQRTVSYVTRGGGQLPPVADGKLPEQRFAALYLKIQQSLQRR